MASWLIIILIAYFVLSVSNLIDKIFLSSIVTESIVYAVWVSFLSVGMVATFVLHWHLDRDTYANLPSLGELTGMDPWFIGVALLVGVLFTVSIYLLYTALQHGEASRVIPLIGGSMPIIILLLTVYYEPLTMSQLWAFVFLVIGTILIAWMPPGKKRRKNYRAILLALGASFSFSLFITLTQYLFRHNGFINGLVWPRLGTAVILIALLSVPSIREKTRSSLRHLSAKMRASWLSNQALGALGFLGQQYVISIPGVSAALVSALQSVQYAYILVFASILTVLRPNLLRESVTGVIIAQKIAAVLCIAIGLYYIAV